ncbi:MFS transporter [Streptomyces sp. NBC_01304]|uniref:MFS transporter n=1 Tax=Streptomyces sp. NBC_01304 TaxID=2903818 RepID=UPI002E12847A|nr:MFS transporter [Streptomyces sp. NBC_01304]
MADVTMADPADPAEAPVSGPGGRRWVWASIVSLAVFLYGYCAGVAGGAVLYIPDDYRLSTSQKGLVVSVFLLGAAVGALGTGRISDRYGRKPVLVASGVLFAVGMLVTMTAPDLVVLLLGRVVQGLAAGLASAVVPVYLSEVSTPRIRGRMVSLNQLGVTLGLLAAYLVGLAFSGARDWRWMFGAGLVPTVVLLAGLLFVPESSARHSSEDASSGSGGFKALLDRSLRPAMAIGLVLAVLQQVAGINAVLYFAPTIMQDTGLDASNSLLYSVYLGALNVVLTMVSIQLVDRWGRRPLLLLSTGLMVVALIPLGASFVWDLGSGPIALICLLAYVAAFAIGLGPVFWLMVPEMLPAKARAAGAALCTMANWAANFVVSQFFLNVIDAIGEGQTFWLFAVLCAAGFFYILWRVPETKDRTVGEITAGLGAQHARRAG